MVDLTVVRIFVSDSQHFVLIEGTLEGDVTQRTVERIFAGCQQTRRLHFLVVNTADEGVAVEVSYGTEGNTRLIDLTEVRRVGFDLVIESVGVIVRCRFGCTAPFEFGVVVTLT